MYVELIQTGWDKSQVLATISIRNGKVVIDGDLPPRILDLLGGIKEKTPDTAHFLEALPKVFTNAYFRAKLYP